MSLLPEKRRGKGAEMRALASKEGAVEKARKECASSTIRAAESGGGTVERRGNDSD